MSAYSDSIDRSHRRSARPEPVTGPGRMPAITIRPPWPALTLAAMKQVETRPQPILRRHVGNRIAVHVGEQFHPFDDMLRRCIDSGIVAPMTALVLGASHDRTIVPRGHVIGTVKVSACVPIVDTWPAQPRGTAATTAPCLYAGPDHPPHLWTPETGHKGLAVPEHWVALAGDDWQPGRWAALLTAPWTLPTPIPARGRQGVWTWEHPICGDAGPGHSTPCEELPGHPGTHRHRNDQGVHLEWAQLA